MSAGRIVTWSTLAAALLTLLYFRGDVARYAKMKMM